MPSPVAHIAMGYVVYRASLPYVSKDHETSFGSVPRLLAIAAAFSLLPDIDAGAGIVMGDMGRFHNNATHSLFSTFLVALGIGALAKKFRRGRFAFWFSLSLACYGLHVLMDRFSTGRGVMLFWPLSTQRYSSPFTLFYGLHWSHGWISIDHLWTVATESVFSIGPPFLVAQVDGEENY